MPLTSAVNASTGFLQGYMQMWQLGQEEKRYQAQMAYQKSRDAREDAYKQQVLGLQREGLDFEKTKFGETQKEQVRQFDASQGLQRRAQNQQWKISKADRESNAAIAEANRTAANKRARLDRETTVNAAMIKAETFGSPTSIYNPDTGETYAVAYNGKGEGVIRGLEKPSDLQERANKAAQQQADLAKKDNEAAESLYRVHFPINEKTGTTDIKLSDDPNIRITDAQGKIRAMMVDGRLRGMTKAQQQLSLYRAKGDLASVGINPQSLYDPFYLSPQEHSEAKVAVENGIMSREEFEGYEKAAEAAISVEAAENIWAGYKARKKALEELQAAKAKSADGSKPRPTKPTTDKPLDLSKGGYLRYSVF